MKSSLFDNGKMKILLVSLVAVFLFAAPVFHGGLLRDAGAQEGGYYEKEIDLGKDYLEQYLIGEDLGQGLGHCIKSGDLNGDGLDDMVLGAPGFNQSKGGIFIFYGGGKERSQFSRDADILIDSHLPGNKMGMDIAIGDADGDGLLDILVSGWANEGTYTGGGMASIPEVYLFLGSSGWNPQMSALNADVTFQAQDREHVLGWNIEMGDMNQDGMDEIFISDIYTGYDPYYFRDYIEGKIYVWDGSLDFDDRYDVGEGEFDHVIYNSEMHWHDNVGYNAVGSSDLNIGDVNNDGYMDVLIGSSYLFKDNINSGEVDIVLGGDLIKDSMDLMVLPRISIQGYEDFMLSGVECADVNGDGLNDILVSAPNCFYDRVGGIFIFYGQDPQPTGRNYLIDADFVIRGAYSGFDLGFSTIGDLDGDGRDDLLISSPFGHSGGKGTYYLFHSSTIGEVEDRGESTYFLRLEQPKGMISGPASGLDFGASYFENAVVCDLDGIDEPEIVIGSPNSNWADSPSKAGLVYVLYPVMSSLTIEYFELKELEGQDHNVVGAGKEYHFEGYVKDSWDASDIEGFHLGFDFSDDLDGYGVHYNWDSVSREFTETGDFEGFVELTGYDVVQDGNYGMKVYMNVIFHPRLYSEAPIDVSFDAYAGKEMEAHFFGGNMIKVEADVEFTGTMKVTGSVNGELTKGSFVQPGEDLVLTGLKAVYQGTDIAPPNDYFSVLMADSYGTIFLNRSSSGSDILFRTRTKQIAGREAFTFSLVDLRGTADDVSGSPYIFVNVDTDLPEAPDQLEIRADSDIDTLLGFDNDPEVWVTWFPSDDKSSNIIGYMYNTYDGAGTGDGYFIDKNWFVYNGLDIGWNTIYVWAIDEALNHGPASAASVYYDVEEPIFGLPDPRPGEWVNSINVNYEIFLYDTEGSGVKGSTVEYAISYDGGNTYSAWEPTNIRRDSEQLKVRLFLNFREGENNYVKWRAMDVAGNGYVFSDPYQVKVDTQQLTYKEPVPSEAIDGNYVSLGITLEDKGSGIDASSIEYSISFNGVSNYGPWERMDMTGSFQSQYVETPRIFFERDTFNYVRWRAKDVAGNGYTYSEDISIIILPEPRNHDPVPIISNPVAYNYYLESTLIELDGSKSIDTDMDELTYLWYSDKDGYLGTEDIVKVKLSRNNHKITLHVNDGISDVSISVDIYVLTDTTVADTDGDGIPDLIDEDDDNDGLLDLEEDTNRNNLYDENETDFKNWDTDGDGVSDKLDAAPLDPDVQYVNKEGYLPFAVILVVVLFIMIILVVIGVIISMKQKTDREKQQARISLRRNRRNIKRFEVLTGVPTNDLPAVEAVQWALPSVISQASEFVVETPPSDNILPSPEEKPEDEVKPPEEEKPDLQDMEVPLPAEEVSGQDAPEPPTPDEEVTKPMSPSEMGTSVTCSLCGSEFSIAPGQTSGECPLCGEMVNL